MNKGMTRNMIPLLAILFLVPTWSFATADSPVVQGLGGAGRAGLPAEALFTNPASIALVTQSTSYLIYEKPNIKPWDAGGRAYSVGIYDGTNDAMKGGFGYMRTAKARIDEAGQQGYEDRTEYRANLGRQIMGSVLGGVHVRYVTRRIGPVEKKFFTGDVGAIFPVYSGLSAGVTYENVLTVDGEPPATAGGGLTYLFGYGIQAYGDGYRFLKGPKKDQQGWALGMEAVVGGDFKLRGGKFQDGYRRLKGWSLGFAWAGPRTSFDYAMRTTGTGPRERDHIVGMTVAL